MCCSKHPILAKTGHLVAFLIRRSWVRIPPGLPYDTHGHEAPKCEIQCQNPREKQEFDSQIDHVEGDIKRHETPEPEPNSAVIPPSSRRHSIRPIAIDPGLARPARAYPRRHSCARGHKARRCMMARPSPITRRTGCLRASDGMLFISCTTLGLPSGWLCAGH